MRTAAVAEHLGQLSEQTHLCRGEIPERVATMTNAKPGCFCFRTLVRDQSRNSSECTVSRGSTFGTIPGPMTVVDVARSAISSSASNAAEGGGGSSIGGASRSNGSHAAAPSRASSANALALVLGTEALPSERPDEELQAIALLVLVVAEAMEDADDGLRAVEHLVGGQELVQHAARARQRRGAAGDGDLEAVHGPAVDLLHARVPADVVDRRSDVIGRAALERDLELARQDGAQRMAEEVARQRLGVRRDVERFVRARRRRTGTR